MSRVNGDKSRFNRVRKQNAAKRMRNRELLKSITQGKVGCGSGLKRQASQGVNACRSQTGPKLSG